MRRYWQHYSVHIHRYLWYTPTSLWLLTEYATSSNPIQYKNTPFCSTHHLAWGCLLNKPLRTALSSKKTCNSVFYVKVRLMHLYVNTTLLTLLHPSMFQPSRGHPQDVLIQFVSRATKYVSRYKYQIKGKRDTNYVTLQLEFCSIHHLACGCLLNAPLPSSKSPRIQLLKVK